MRPSLLRLATIALALQTQTLSADVGYTTGTLDVAHRAAPLSTHLWYPATGGGAPHVLGRNVVFSGHTVRRDAPAAAGTYPLVVLSHGSGGNAANLSWIASALAESGVVVMATNHPGTTSGDSAAEHTIKLWERPADLSALVDAALEGPMEGLRINPDAVGALGFSLGGFSVLSLVGAAADPQAYADYCVRISGRYDCAWLTRGGVDTGALDADPRYAQPNTDPRIRAVAAVDPALAAAQQTERLAGISAQVQLINLGAPGTVPLGVNAAALAQAIPQAAYHAEPEATHFSFLGLCTHKGAAIIKEAGEDPICDEAGSRPRADIHRALAARISAFFAAQFALTGS